MPAQSIELTFPVGGVQRKTSSKAGASTSPPTTPWACNVRTEDAIDRRLRGGSRPGLTKYTATDYGAVISDIASLKLSSASGVSERLIVLADTQLNVTNNGVNVANGSAAVPSSGFLVTGQQKAFVVTSSGVVSIDPKTGTVGNLATTAGTQPAGCTFGAIYRDRLILSGEDNAIYASRLGKYTDWNFGVDQSDTLRAVAFQLSLSNEIGAKPTAMIPHKDSYLICATERSLWVVRGDPVTGELSRISENVGIVSSRAWCRADDTIVFLAKDGLYRINADGSNLTQLSPQSVPDELRNVNTSTTQVSIGYDYDRLAFYVFLRTNAGNDTHWIYEQQTEAFWPIVLPSNFSPRFVCRHEGELLLAGSDGFVRKIGGTTDDGTNIQSHVLIGPIRLGELDRYGLVNVLHGILGNGSGQVNWRLVTGESADIAADNGKAAIQAFQAGNSYASYVKASGSWTGSRSLSARPRVRGMWVCIWLQSTATWGLEGITMEVGATGNWRG